MQDENLNLVAGTNIELVRTGNDVYVNNTYDYDPSTIEAEVGTLSNLTTTVKTDLVSAINEVNGNTTTLGTNKEDKSNKVTTLSGSSTDTQYPSAKCVYDLIGDIESILETLDIGEGV